MTEAPPPQTRSIVKDPGFLTGTAALLASGAVFIYARQSMAKMDANIQQIITTINSLGEMMKQHGTRLNEFGQIHKTANVQLDTLTKQGKKTQRMLSSLEDQVVDQQTLIESLVAALPEDVRSKLDAPAPKKAPVGKPIKKAAKRVQRQEEDDEEDEEDDDDADILDRVRRQRGRQ